MTNWPDCRVKLNINRNSFDNSVRVKAIHVNWFQHHACQVVSTQYVLTLSVRYETDCLLALNIKLQPPVYIRMAVSAYCCYQFEYKMSNVGSFSRLDCTALCTTPEAISSLGYNRTEFCHFFKEIS